MALGTLRRREGGYAGLTHTFRHAWAHQGRIALYISKPTGDPGIAGPERDVGRSSLLLPPASSTELAGRLSARGQELGERSARLAQTLSHSKRLWKQLRTTNVIERCLVEVRRSSRTMVVLTTGQSAHRIAFAIFHRCNEDWRSRTLGLFAPTSGTTAHSSICLHLRTMLYLPLIDGPLGLDLCRRDRRQATLLRSVQ